MLYVCHLYHHISLLNPPSFVIGKRSSYRQVFLGFVAFDTRYTDFLFDVALESELATISDSGA